MWYREGTYSLIKGSNTVIGVGTSWSKSENGVLPGMILLGKKGEPFEVKSVESDTSLTLVEPYDGDAASSIPSRIITTYQGDISQFAARFAAQLQRMNVDSGVIRAWLTSGIEAELIAEDGTTITLKSLRQIIAEHDASIEWFNSSQEMIEAAAGNATAAAQSSSAAAVSQKASKTSETNAASSASSAASSKAAAGTSATNAKTSETNAKASETNAKTSETAACESASSAATSETNAKASESAAGTSASNSATSEINAAASASSAASSKGSAATSATNAGTSATNAKTSETNAKKSESNAKLSENAAAASQSSAAASETNASTSETNAAASAAAGKTSETNAASSKSAAATSATSAKTSETNAASSKTAAATSATNAASSEANAKTSETNAKSSETNAKASENAAAGSKSAAASSATASKTSETNAAASASAAAASAKSVDADNIWTKTALTKAVLMGLGLAPSDSPSFTGQVDMNNVLNVSSAIKSGYRMGVIRDDAFPAYMVFSRTDQIDGTPPTVDTGVLNIWGRLASTTSDIWAGRSLGGMVVSYMPSGGGKTYLDARDSTGGVTSKLWLDSGDKSANFSGAGGLNVTGGGGITSDGSGSFLSDAIGVQLQPKTKDKSYYIRGKKSDGSLHWYLGQSSDNTNTVTLGNTIAGTWLTLLADGNGSSNVKTMTYNNAVEVNGGMRVSHPNGALVADSTNAALVVGGSSTDGSQGLSVNTFAPTVAFVDRSANSASFRWRGDANYLRLDVDGQDNGATWQTNKAMFSQAGNLTLGGSGASASVMLMLGYNKAGNGTLTGTSQYGAATHFNIGSDATVRGVSYLSEMTLGDGATDQTLADWVDFWANSQTVNDKAAVTLSSSFRAYDKSSASVATSYAFDGRMMTRDGVNRWNLYLQGSAPNFIRGQTIVGGTNTSLPDSKYNLEVRGSQRISGDLAVDGMIYANRNDGCLSFSSKDGSLPVYTLNYSGAGNFGFWDQTKQQWSLRKDTSDNWYTPASLNVGDILDVKNQINSGYRVNIMRSNGYVPYQNFVRGDLPADKTPTSETAVGQVFFKTASSTSDDYAGRNLGLLQVNMTPNGGGKTYLDARNQAGTVKARLILDADQGMTTVNGDIYSDGNITTKGTFDSSRMTFSSGSAAGGRYYDYSAGNLLYIGDSGIFNFYNKSKGNVLTVDSANLASTLQGTLTIGTTLTITGSGTSNMDIGSGASDVYLHNSKSNKYLQLKDTGELMYSSQEVYHAGNKPTAAEVGALPLSGGTVTGPVVSTDANGFRIKAGNVASFMRNDGTTTYFLLTNSGDQNGSWNSLRPIYWNNTSGAVTMGHAVTIGGMLTGNGNASFNDVYIRSDRRNKRNIKKIECALDKLEKIDGVLYELQGLDGFSQSGGLVAQQVQEVQPELVTSDIDHASQEERLRLNYNGVIGMLVEAVKELRAEVKELKEARA